MTYYRREAALVEEITNLKFGGQLKPTIDKLQARIKELEVALAVLQKHASDVQVQKTEAEDRCRR